MLTIKFDMSHLEMNVVNSNLVEKQHSTDKNFLLHDHEFCHPPSYFSEKVIHFFESLTEVCCAVGFLTKIIALLLNAKIKKRKFYIVAEDMKTLP